MTLLILLFTLVHCEIPGYISISYSQPGDIMLGALLTIRRSASYSTNKEYLSGDMCSDMISDRGAVNAFIAVNTINEINARDDILRNITLGITIEDNCGSDMASIAGSMRLVGVENNGMPNVVAVVGPETSSHCVRSAEMFGLYNIPSIGTYASSAELSNKLKYRYFLRMVPNDQVLVKAIIATLLEMDWTYVSLIYEESSFGEFGYKQFYKLAAENNICIAFSHMIVVNAKTSDYVNTIDTLLVHGKARAVVMFTGFIVSKMFFRTIYDQKVDNHFIWMGTVPFQAFYRYYDVIYGALYFEYTYKQDVYEYEQALLQFSVEQAEMYPWYRHLWTQTFDCSWLNNATNPCSNYTKLDESMMLDGSKWAVKTKDGIYAVAYALDSLIEMECPNTTAENEVELIKCINGPALLTRLKNISFEGDSEQIDFDKNGDFLGSYTIKQFVATTRSRLKYVGRWNQHNRELSLNESLFEWPNKMYSSTNLPQSVCSLPCPKKSYAVRLELICCWECRTCRNNEIIVNNSSCVQCPDLTWPDDTDILECVAIAPGYIVYSDSLGLVFIVLSTIGGIISLLIIAFYIKRRKVKLIMASSRELSLVILVGVLLSFITVCLSLIEPTTWSCRIDRICFNLTMTFMYGPLFVKTNRVYRIFRESMLGNKRPQFISTTSQICVSFVIISSQVGSCTTMLLYITYIYHLHAALYYA